MREKPAKINASREYVRTRTISVLTGDMEKQFGRNSSFQLRPECESQASQDAGAYISKPNVFNQARKNFTRRA